MGFSKIQAVSLTELFIQQIEKMILSGELAVGEQLPPARELSVRMGVSRPVISAGLLELEKVGFVEIKPRQGVYVSDYRRKGTIETLVAIMKYNGGALRRNEVRSILEVRDACECLCIKLVLKNCSDEEIETLVPYIDAIAASKDAEEAAAQCFDFYHELTVLSGNELIPLLYTSFREQGIYLWSMFCKKNGINALYELKKDFYAMLLNRNEEAAYEHTHSIMNIAIENLSFYGA